MQQFEAEAHPEVLIAMRQTITSMLGTLPPQFFRVVISTEAENLAQLMYSVLMSGCAPGGRRRGRGGPARRWLAGGGGVHGPWRAGERARAWASAAASGGPGHALPRPLAARRREHAPPRTPARLAGPHHTLPPLHLARPAATCLPTPGRG